MITSGLTSLWRATPNHCTRPAAIPASWDWPAETKRSEDWPQFWDHVHTWMKEQGYAHSTARLYRQVLRNFARVASNDET